MNEKIKVLIVDDEPLARRGIAKLLADEPDFVVCGEAADAARAITEIAASEPDLIFLDIQMPLLDGFGLVEKLGDKNLPEIIFVTAFDEHALRAFEIGALDYVLKPINPARFRAALERVKKRINSGAPRSFEAKFERLLENLKTPAPDYLTRVAVKENETIRFVGVEQIERIASQGNYVEIFTKSGKFLLRETMDGIESKLDPKEFVRVRRSAIVGVRHIKELQTLFGGEFSVVLKSGAELISSRRYRKNLDFLLKN